MFGGAVEGVKVGVGGGGELVQKQRCRKPRKKNKTKQQANKKNRLLKPSTPVLLYSFAVSLHFSLHKYIYLCLSLCLSLPPSLSLLLPMVTPPFHLQPIPINSFKLASTCKHHASQAVLSGMQLTLHTTRPERLTALRS